MTNQLNHKQRWSESFTDPSGAAFAAIVRADVVLEGSIFARPIHGRQAVWTTLQTAAGIYDTLAFACDAQRDGRAYLDWAGAALGQAIAGVTVLRLDDSSLVASVAIHHRPLGAVIAFSAELGRRLAGQVDADHFFQPG
jgi:hypothetical protein